MDPSDKRSDLYQALQKIASRLLQIISSAAFLRAKKDIHLYCYDQSYWAEMNAVAIREEIACTSIIELDKDYCIFEVFIDDDQ